jgi:hypothetical protein
VSIGESSRGGKVMKLKQKLTNQMPVNPMRMKAARIADDPFMNP